MNKWNKSRWSLYLFAAAGLWAVVEGVAEMYRRKSAKLAIAADVQEWENEGGAPLPAKSARS